MGDSSVDTRVLSDSSVTSDILANDAVTTDKIATECVTRDKLAECSVTLDKLAEELRKLLLAAIGLPEDLVEKIQNIDESIQDIQNQVNDFVSISDADINKIIDGTYVPVPVQPSASLDQRVRNVEEEVDNIKKSNMKPNEIKEVLI